MDYDREQKIKPHMMPHESLLWSGRPKSGVVFRLWDIYLIPFSLFWTTFAIFVLWKVKHFAPAIFIIIGIYIILGRFYVDSIIRSKTFYGLTNKRIIIVTGLFIQYVRSFSLDNLPAMRIVAKSDGSGTIIIGSNRIKYTWPPGLYWPFTGKYVQPSLEFISDVNTVYKEILSAQEKLEQDRN